MSGVNAARRGIQRYGNGSAEIDSYRVYATALRGQGIRDRARMKKLGAGLLVMAGILAVPLLLAGVRPALQGSVAVVQADTTSAVR
jgi:hypothetical protein